MTAAKSRVSLAELVQQLAAEPGTIIFEPSGHDHRAHAARWKALAKLLRTERDDAQAKAAYFLDRFSDAGCQVYELRDEAERLRDERNESDVEAAGLRLELEAALDDVAGASEHADRFLAERNAARSEAERWRKLYEGATRDAALEASEDNASDVDVLAAEEDAVHVHDWQPRGMAYHCCGCAETVRPNETSSAGVTWEQIRDAVRGEVQS